MFYKIAILPLILSLAGLLTAHPIESRDVCVVLAPGQYKITSEQTGWQLRPYHHAMAPPAIQTQPTPPTPANYGVWSLTNAPQSAYYMGNVGEGSIVATLTFGGNPQPYTTSSTFVGPVAFAIQCAGNGTYVIKNPTADEVWTAQTTGLNWITMIGADGDIAQRFRFTKV